MAPITDPSLPPCTSNAAERTTALLSASVADLKQIARASPPFLRRSPRRVDQATRPARALWAPTVAAAPSSNQLLALKSLQPWPQLGPNARSKSLQPSAPRRPLQEEQLRARRPLAKPKRPRPRQSSAVKLWPQASAAATFTRQTLLRLNLPQLQRSASASE